MGTHNGSNSVRPTVTLPHLKDIRKSTLSETYKYLHELIKGKSIANLSEVISVSTPLPVFEESLRLMLIDCLQLEKEVLNVLLSQNDYQIKRILQCKWFFENLSSAFCIKEIFPFVSQSLRCKIINKLSKHLNNMEEAEKYFAFVRANYDNARADYLLPRCSSQFILDHCLKNKTMFDNSKTHKRILLNISKRYPEVGIRILSAIFDRNMKENHGSSLYYGVVTYLSAHHPDLMVPFLKNYLKSLPQNIFGRKLTRKLVPKLKGDIFPGFAEKILFRELVFFQILSFEEKVKFFASIVRYESQDLSADNWVNLDFRMSKLLKLVKQDSRLALVEAAFREVYCSNYSDNSSFWGDRILELLPKQSRHSYAETLEKFLKLSTSEYNKNVHSVSFRHDCPEKIISLYDANTAFNKLKELLRKTPSELRRRDILQHMVKNCGINNDVRTLGEVVEYVATRHRNDEAYVIQNFIGEICYYFPATALNSEIFEKIEDLLHFFFLKGTGSPYHYNLWMERYIYYCLENGMDVDDKLKKLFKSVASEDIYGGPFLRDVRNKHSRTVIVDFCKKTAALIGEKKLDDKLNHLLSVMLSTCSEFNKQRRKGRIYLRDIHGLGGILKRELKNEFGEAGGAEWSMDVWEKYYSDVLVPHLKPKSLLFALKRGQHLIEKHLAGILNILFADCNKTRNDLINFILKSVSFFGKTDQFKGLILKEFKNGGSMQRRKNALMLYSRVCNIEEFTKMIEEYIPKQEKVGYDRNFGEIQMSIPRHIKNILPRWKNAQLLLKFLFGDFLKVTIKSFFCCCHHTRCDVAIPFLKEHLNNVPLKVSYRKDLINLILQLSDRKGRWEFCLKSWKEYENYSIRGILLREMSKLFLEQPSRESLEALEKCILECDTMVIDMKPSLDKMPVEYWDDYVSVLWRFSEDKDPSFRNKFRQDILWNFGWDNISFISRDLAETIIKSDLFVPSSEIQVERFTSLYLSADPNTVEDRVNMILTLIKTRKADAVAVNALLNVLINTAWDHPVHFNEAFAVMLKNWPSYPLGVLYKQKILFTYHNIHQKVVKRTNPELVPVEFGKELRSLYESIPNLKDLIPMYSQPLLQFFSKFQTSKAVLAVKELVTGCKDRTIAVLAIASLPDEAVVCYRTKDMFDKTKASIKKTVTELVEIFENYGDDIVEIYLRDKFELQMGDSSMNYYGDA